MTDIERIKKLAEWAELDGEWYGPIFCIEDGLRHWNPLERIQDAWMLVEKARVHPDGLWLSLIYKGTPPKWCAEFRVTSFEAISRGALKNNDGHFYAEAPTAPLAICAAIEKLMEAKCKP